MNGEQGGIEHPHGVANFNLASLISIRIYFSVVVKRVKKFGAWRCSPADPYAPEDEIIAEAEKHLFSPPGQDIECTYFRKEKL